MTADVRIGRTIRAGGSFVAKQTDFGIKPFSGGPGGTVKVADKVTFCFDLVATRNQADRPGVRLGTKKPAQPHRAGMCRQSRRARATPNVGSLPDRELLVDHPRLRAHATDHPIRLAVSSPERYRSDRRLHPHANDRTTGAWRFYPRREPGGRQTIGVQSDVGVNRSRPDRRTALLHRCRGGNAEGVRLVGS